MTSAVVQLNFIPKRMLTKAEAAHHCGRPIKRFGTECPIKPVLFDNGDLRYDVQDLDSWLNDLKRGTVRNDADDIVMRLA
jgi:hypothetical protein